MRKLFASTALLLSMTLMVSCVSSVPVNGVKVPVKTAKKAVKTAAKVGGALIPGGSKKKKKAQADRVEPTRPQATSDMPRSEPRRPD